VSCARFKTFARTFQVSLKITPRMVSVDGDAACRAAVLSRGKATQIVQSPAPAVGELRPYSGTLEIDDGQWVQATKTMRIPDTALLRTSTLKALQTLRSPGPSIAGVARGQEAAPIIANNTSRGPCHQHEAALRE